MVSRRAPSSNPRASDPLTLAAAQRHDVVRVLNVSGRPRLVQRLAALGVVPGASMTVLKARGPAVVSLGGARIAVGRSAARSVEIEVEQ